MLFLTVVIRRQDLAYQGQSHRALPGEGVPVFLEVGLRFDPAAVGRVVDVREDVGRLEDPAVVGDGVPEERMRQGLVPDWEIWRNTSLPDLTELSAAGALPTRAREVQRGRQAPRGAD